MNYKSYSTTNLPPNRESAMLLAFTPEQIRRKTNTSRAHHCSNDQQRLDPKFAHEFTDCVIHCPPVVRVDPRLRLGFNLAMNKKLALVLIVLLGAGLNSFAQTNSTPGAPTAGIVAAAKNFLARLDDGQRGKVVFDFKDDAQRKRWSNLPTTIFKRQGLHMGKLTQPQRDAV